ncbi:MAG: ABC transporter permease [Conexivisphaera sp.]
MRGSLTVIEKELSENLTSRRFILMFLLVFLSGAGAVLTTAQSLSGLTTAQFLEIFTGAGNQLYSYTYFLSILAPVLGIAIGFDSVNRELSSGSMVRLLSNPIHRDGVLIGKLAAGVALISLVIGTVNAVDLGLGMILMGWGPSLADALRYFYFTVVTIIYSSVWYSIALFFSTILRRAATSALASLGLWIFMTFFIGAFSTALASVISPLPAYPPPTLQQEVAYIDTAISIARVSPVYVYSEVSATLLNPYVITLSPVYVYTSGMPRTPLGVSGSLALALPDISALMAAFSVFSIMAFIAFMRMEIRARWE